MTNGEINNCAVTIKQLAKELMPGWVKKEKTGWEPDDEKWFHWPPDLFALTSIFLKTTGLYCYTVTPHPLEGKRVDCGLPKKEQPQQMKNINTEWHRWILGIHDDFPKELLRHRKVLFSEKDEAKSEDGIYFYDYCCAVMSLHMFADHACSGMGILSTAPYGQISAIYFLANYLMDVSGTLSRIPKRHGVVLPKMRTPQRGLTLRSFSHNLTFHRSEVNVLWRTVPWDDRNKKTVNILTVPMPYEISPEAFAPCSYPGFEDDVKEFKYFEYAPKEPFDIDAVINLLEAAHKEVDRVHILVFPELAMTEAEFFELKLKLASKIKPPHQIPMVITGVRGEDREQKNQVRKDQVRKNQVKLSVYFANRWYDMGQDKHHKWKLDKRQIQQYALGGRLNVQNQWWEAIDLEPPRHLTFLAPNGWLTICPLICEDLAQLEPISDLIRGVGPTLVVAILMDGPQLPQRWPARYVSVLADDPGTSVLTLTSLGMAVRSRAKGKPTNRTVALWKDQVTDSVEIELREGSEAVLLTVTAETREEFTADGRSDNGAASLLVLQSTCELRQGKARKPANKARAKVKGTAAEKERGASTPADLKELTAISFLAGAIIDAPGELIKEFRRYASEGIKDGDNNRVMQIIKPFETLWEQIREGLRTEKEWHYDEFDYAVDQLCKFMIPVNSKLNDLLKMSTEEEIERRNEMLELEARMKEQLPRWDALAKKALREVELQDSSVKLTSKNKNSKLPEHKKKRFERIVFISILWAIYNRLLILPPDIPESVHDTYNELKSRIEEWMASTSGY